MGADDADVTMSAGKWGPVALADTIRAELNSHGLADVDAAECARRLANAQGPATKASLFVDLGALNFLDGDVAGAIATWRQAAASGQAAPATRAVFNLGLLHDELGLSDRAVELFSQVVSQGTEPHASRAVLAKARAQDRAGDSNAAIETLAAMVDTMLSDRPNDPLLGRALLGIGEIASGAGLAERAEQAYRVAATAPDPAAAQLAGRRLVRMLRVNGRTDEAQDLVARLELDDHDPDLAFERIVSLLALGDESGADQLIDRCDPRRYGTNQAFRFTEILERAGRVNESIDELEVLLGSQVPEVEARAAVRLGRIYAANEMPDAAQAMFESVLASRVPYWSDQASLLLGDLLHDTGDPKAAAQHWAEAAASGVDSIAGGARERLVDAVGASQIPPRSVPGAAGPTSDAGATGAVVDTDWGGLTIGLAEPAATDTSGSNPVEEPSPALATAAPTEPTVIVLSRAEPLPIEPVAGEQVVLDLTENGSADGLNPYAELAPPPVNGDVKPSGRNPYAELAPNYPTTDAEIGSPQPG